MLRLYEKNINTIWFLSKCRNTRLTIILWFCRINKRYWFPCEKETENKMKKIWDRKEVVKTDAFINQRRGVSYFKMLILFKKIRCWIVCSKKLLKACLRMHRDLISLHKSILFLVSLERGVYKAMFDTIAILSFLSEQHLATVPCQLHSQVSVYTLK